MYLELTPENQNRFLGERDQYRGKHDDFLKELLARQRE
jgi:hypothetical protein